jgi:hypothetical protein
MQCHGTHVHVISLAHKESKGFRTPKFTQLTNDQQRYVPISYTELQPDRTKNVQSIELRSFSPLSKVWISLGTLDYSKDIT